VDFKGPSGLHCFHLLDWFVLFASETILMLRSLK